MERTNAQMREVLSQYEKLNPLPIESLSPDVARQLPELKDAVMAVLNEHPTKRLLGILEDVESEEHKLIPGPEGDLLIRIYKPSSEGPHPVLLYFHGGGFVLANLNSYDSSCRALTNAAECIVVSLAYRQAPEHKFPAARDDAFAAYKWLLENANSIGGDAHRIAVGGESAGGNLAALVCLMARKERLPQPVHQLLIYPLLDSSMRSESYRKYSNAKPLNAAMMKWFFKQAFQEKDLSDPFAFPLLQTDLAGLAPTTVITAEVDPLCSEGESYAKKLQSSGVPVSYQRFSEVSHEFFGMVGVLDEAEEAIMYAADNLMDSFEQNDVEAREFYHKGLDSHFPI